MRAWGRAVVVSCATATVLMAVDGCARAEPAAAGDAALETVQTLGPPHGYGPVDPNGYGAYGRGWPGQTFRDPRAWGGDWWPPRYGPQQQWQPRATRPYWSGPRWQPGTGRYARGNRDWDYRGGRYPDQRYDNRYRGSRPYTFRQYQRPYGHADWQWAQRY